MKHAGIWFLSLVISSMAFAQKNDSAIALIKKSLTDSKEKIKHYEWIETTITYVKGDQKSKKQTRCYYDVTGKLIKVATGETQAAEKSPGGLRGKAVDKKKDEMQDYIEKSIAKIQAYLPPDPAKLQQIYGSGKAVVHVVEPNKKFKLDFPSYLQQGDMISVALDKEKNLLNGLSVNTYLDKPDDKINFETNYGSLPDGTQYPASTTLDAQDKNVKIVIQNAGYKKTVN